MHHAKTFSVTPVGIQKNIRNESKGSLYHPEHIAYWSIVKKPTRWNSCCFISREGEAPRSHGMVPHRTEHEYSSPTSRRRRKPSGNGSSARQITPLFDIAPMPRRAILLAWHARICKSIELEADTFYPSIRATPVPHGHTRSVEMVFRADSLDASDMVLDFKAVKQMMGDFLQQFDHSLCMNTEDRTMDLSGAAETALFRLTGKTPPAR